MQINSCTVFANNDLFGTYQEASGAFEYTTYAEYADNVERCRAVLKDLGELR
jgi:long-subunit acyl-CoA synthetase (AMP-forming)